MFEPGAHTLDSLIGKLQVNDFAIVVMTSDDLTIAASDLEQLTIENIKNIGESSPRDNVVFELGLSIAILGKDRAFLIRDRNPKLKVPTDLSGYTPLDFDGSLVDNPRLAVGPACNTIKGRVKKLGPRESPIIPPLSQVHNEYLRSLGASILGTTAAAIKSLVQNASSQMAENDYLSYLIGQINDLKKGDLLFAICGGKNYELPEVYEYLNKNVELAQAREVQVRRLYVAPDGTFDDCEWEVVDAHLTWAKELDSFNVGVLVGPGECKQLLELNLPLRFGLVLTRHRGLWESRIHYGLDDGQQGGWNFKQEAIILKLRKLFEDLYQRAVGIEISPEVQSVKAQVLARIKPDSRLWRLGEPCPRS